MAVSLVMAGSSSAQAVDINDDDIKNVCSQLSLLGGIFMSQRQDGMSEDDMTNIVLKANPSIINIAMGLVTEAYALPLATNKSDKQSITRKFVNDQYTSCYELMSENQ
jgi:hypothetical protein